MAHKPLACERHHSARFDAATIAQDGFGSALGGAAKAAGGALKSMTKPWQKESPGDPFRNPSTIPDKPAKDAEPAALAGNSAPPPPAQDCWKSWIKAHKAHGAAANDGPVRRPYGL